MKVYISADIEGTAGITTWDEATKTHAFYPEHRRQMTQEVLAACRGAQAAGASELLIKDAHDTGTNILQEELPDCARLIRGWSGHPFAMVQDIDASFDAAVFVGYHSRAGAEGNPLAHTMALEAQRMRLNGQPCSEWLLHATACATVGVPVVFVSGDRGLCDDIAALNPATRTLAVSAGRGPSSTSLAPAAACRLIEQGVAAALAGDRAAALMPLAPRYVLEIEFNNPISAYRAQWYPGARHQGDRLVRFEAEDFFDILRALRSVL